MTISAGSQIGSYKVLSPLGAGGMGEVWRARDIRLGRDVAIKVLPAELAREGERLARFEREARLLAALNHPNVAAIYGLEVFDDAPHLILECVEGETLAERLAAGPLPVSEALSLCRQIALALEAAHEAGVIHRDLKPANVKIRPDGSIKVLDFGLAKFVEPEKESRDLSQSPTITTGGTRSGMILGTAAYMSPEQARGRALDKRTDIFSFGCVLYECMTGRQVFRGESVSDTLAAILKSDPDWRELPPETPTKVRDLLRRCLEKTRERRLHDIADARLEIEEAIAAPREASAAASVQEPRRPIRRGLVWAAAAGLAAGALAAIAVLRALAPSLPHQRPISVSSVLTLPPETRLNISPFRQTPAFSPDGRRLVFRGIQDRGGLYIRALDSPQAVAIPGTEGGFDPFFSPDGEWLGFFTLRELKKVSLAGGSPTTIATVPPVTMGGTWAPDGSIIFAWSVNMGLYTVPAAGGTPRPLTTLDQAAGERAHVFPQVLPDGKNLLLVVRAGKDFQDVPQSNIAVHSLSTGKRRVIVSGSSFAQYAGGYLLFTRGTTVLAAPCDPAKWELTGTALPLQSDVLTAIYDGSPFLAASGKDFLAYVQGGVTSIATDSLVWVDRSGREDPIPLPPASHNTPRISPDGKRVTVTTVENIWGARNNLFLYDFERRVLSSLTPEPGRHFCPAWSPDGRRVAFSLFLTGEPRLAWKAADGSGETEMLSPGASAEFPSSISSDGRWMAYAAMAPKGGQENMDIWLLSLEGKRERRPWLAGPSREFAPFISPDGRWIAYVSSESGRNEVYVRPFSGSGAKVKISAEGGSEPAWSPDGREIFYRTADSLMAVPIRAEQELSAGQARVLLRDNYIHLGREDNPRNYDVSPDGSRFLFIKRDPVKETPVTQINLVTNWPASLGAADGARR